jgi:hypothetical protein
LCADVERKGRRQREGKERKAKIIERGEMWWSLSYASQALKKKKKKTILTHRVNPHCTVSTSIVKPFLVLGIFFVNC